MRYFDVQHAILAPHTLSLGHSLGGILRWHCFLRLLHLFAPRVLLSTLPGLHLVLWNRHSIGRKPQYSHGNSKSQVIPMREIHLSQRNQDNSQSQIVLTREII